MKEMLMEKGQKGQSISPWAPANLPIRERNSIGQAGLMHYSSCLGNNDPFALRVETELWTQTRKHMLLQQKYIMSLPFSLIAVKQSLEPD